MLHMSAFVLLTCSWRSWVKLLDKPVLPFNNKNTRYGALHKYWQQTVDLGETMLALLLCTNDNKYCADCELGFSYYKKGEYRKLKPCFPASPSLPWSSTSPLTDTHNKNNGKRNVLQHPAASECHALETSASSQHPSQQVALKYLNPNPDQTGVSRPWRNAACFFLVVLPGFAIDWISIHLSILMHIIICGRISLIFYMWRSFHSDGVEVAPPWLSCSFRR